MTGNQLRIEIKKLNITQEEAANALGVTRRTLQNWFELEEIDANISQKVKEKLNITDEEPTQISSVNDLVELIRSQQETIKNLSETIKNLTSK